MRIFDPETWKKADGKSQLLICDSHESHVSGWFVTYCFEHNIVQFLLIPYSLHLLKHLDISVFGPLKKAVSASFEKLIRVRLEKVEWMDKYVDEQASTLMKSNTRRMEGCRIGPNVLRACNSIPS